MADDKTGNGDRARPGEEVDDGKASGDEKPPRVSPPSHPSSDVPGSVTPNEKSRVDAEENELAQPGRRKQFRHVKEDGNLVQRALYRALNPPPLPAQRRKAGQYGASFVSRVLFAWPFYTIWAATTRQLDINDIEEVDPRRRAGTKSAEFDAHLRRHAAAKSRYPLIRAIFSTYRTQFVKGIGCAVAFVWTDVGNYYLFRRIGQYLLDAFRHPSPPDNFSDPNYRGRNPLWVGILMMIGFAGIMFVGKLLRFHSNYHMGLAGAEVRMLLASRMYAKAMRASRTAVRPSARSTGGQDGGNWDDDDENEDEEAFEDCCNPSGPESKPPRGPGISWSDRHSRPRRSAAAATTKNESEPAAPSKTQTRHASDVFWTEGPIINSMAVDAGRIEAAIGSFNYIWITLAGMFGWFPSAWYFFSWPGVVAVAALYPTVALLMVLARSISKRRRGINRLTERRANLLMDMLQGVRFLKVFGWEQLFLQRFKSVRANETARLKNVQVATVWNTSVSFLLSRGMNLLVTFLYVAFVGPLDRSYDVMAFQALLLEVSHLLGQTRNATITAIIAGPSVKNIQDFLLAEEHGTGASFGEVADRAHAVELEDAHFSWLSGSVSGDAATGSGMPSPLVPGETFTLRNLDLAVGTTELIAVVGPVGCGKSSLAAGLIGEMSHVGGRVSLDLARVGYCAQTAWIQNATVRENILFGRPLDPHRYEQVVAACALDRDIASEFPSGDLTELGDRGITISGGQKARIQLARTMYRESPVLILDDPLSAVDAGTANHIFEHAILGDMADKCRILITHQLHVLDRCDRVVWMGRGGRILAVDSYENLMRADPAFAEFVGRSAALQQQRLRAEQQQQQAEEVKGLEEIPKRKGGPAGRKSAAGEVRSPSAGGGLMVAEDRAEHAVPWGLYWKYAAMSTPPWVLLLWVAILLTSQASNMVYSMSVAWWSSRQYGLQDWQYAVLMAGMLLCHAATWSHFYVECQSVFLKSAGLIVHRAIEALFRAPMSFFDTNPMGRMMNRFTQDVNTIDNVLPIALWDSMLIYCAMLSQMVAIGVNVPVSFALFLPWALSIYSMLWVYKRTPLELDRLEKLRHSSFVARLAEGVNGRSTLVACERVGDFQDRLHEIIDELNSIHFMAFSATAWVEVRSGIVTCILTFLVGVFVLSLRYTLNPNLGLWCISCTSYFAKYTMESLSLVSEVQGGMNAVQRLEYYCSHLPDEGPRHLPPGQDAAGKDWPTDGSIEITNGSMRYRDGLPLSLKGLDLTIESGEKVGVVGRTGAGKSSLTAVLLRTVNTETGTIKIAGVDTAHVGLHKLRRSLAVIPQDPTLFLGTLRRNLDPTARDKNPDPAVDARLEAALRMVHIIRDENDSDDNGPLYGDNNNGGDDGKHALRRVTLDTKVEATGKNFSAGDRQLIALARALVRDTPIILIDEATSAVDPVRDALIQETIRAEFGGKTVLAIAHRIRTIINYDKVCVMDRGRVAEFGPPRELWRQQGMFRELCDKSKLTEDEFM